MKCKFLLALALMFSKWRPSECQEGDVKTEEEWLATEDPDDIPPLEEVITIEFGRVRGFVYNDSFQHTHQSFTNIPYAKVPVGELRFELPQPPKNWDPEIRDCTAPIWKASTQKRCIQYLNWRVGKIIGSEDCLYLDIIRNADIELEYQYRGYADYQDSRDANVVVTLNTGTFMYDIPLSRQRLAHNLCCGYTIFVFVRYRLGPFGFMTTKDDIMPANLGMHDQIAALKFVQRNIVHFHGEPKKVTLVGASAGAASVHLHMLSRLSAGLFSKAISVSGSALNPWAVSQSSDKLTILYAKRLECPVPPEHSKTEMRDCLKQKPAIEIIEQRNLAFTFRNLPLSAFGPTVDNHFLLAEPHILMAGGYHRPIPWLVSYCAEEGIFPLFDWVDRYPWRIVVDLNWEGLAPYLLHFHDTMKESEQTNMSQLIGKHYLHDGKFLDSPSNLYRLIKMASDRLFILGISEAARLQAKASDAKVYLYEFSYRGEFGTESLLAEKGTQNILRQGTGHIEDFLIYINGYSTAKLTQPGDIQMRQALTWIWSSFIEKGVPELITSDSDQAESPEDDANLELIHAREGISDEPEFVEEIAYTKIKYHGDYSFERSSLLAEKRFWRSIPTNDLVPK
uniref:Seminal fluid protein n=1 Tax=Nilaparvata lugens TaxID=108931 RepID=A0A1I9WL29_NILLU|nr:seminal fluid protein [Nilaparvata lugens]